jgi:hypothetical protein
MQILSLVWGILAIVGMVVAFFPCLGSLNWINIPFSGVGLVVSVVIFATTKEEKKGAVIAGIILCAIAVGLGLVRLFIGGGVV